MANPRCYKCEVSSYYLSCFSAPQGLLCPGRIHPYPALFHHRDYFAPPGFIPILLFFTTGITLPRLDSSLSCSFAPQGLFPPVGCISILLFCSTGIILSRPDVSLSCSFAPQGLFLPPGCISILLFCSTKIISAGRMHLYLALFFHRDDFAPVRCVPSLRTSLPGHSVNFRKSPESMFFNLSYATLDALRKQSFLRLSAAFAAYSPSHNGAFVSKLPQHLMLGLCVAHC